MKFHPLNIALLAALAVGSLFAQEPEYGPAKGTLVIQGGGSDVGTGIFETFINKAGGLDAKIVVVPTAGGNKNEDGTFKEYKAETVLAPWKKRGATNVVMLHTHDPKVADTEAFASVLRDAKGVWFIGGRQWNLVDSYANTATEREFHKVLDRGGVIGGSSAGATIQGDYLVRGAIAGSEIVMAPEPEHQHGFAFLRKVAIDQHINTRNRWDDLIAVIKKYPKEISQPARDRTLGRHGDRRDRRPVPGDRQVESGHS
jgi:cyanophycinase